MLEQEGDYTANFVIVIGFSKKAKESFRDVVKDEINEALKRHGLKLVKMDDNETKA